MKDNLQQIIPCSPGFWVVEVCEDGSVHKTPIVGWLLHTESAYQKDVNKSRWLYGEPIVPGSIRENDDIYIQYPNGEVSLPGVETFETEGDFVKNIISERKSKREKS